MNGTKTISNSQAARIPAVGKRVILSMGGKGGVGKVSSDNDFYFDPTEPLRLIDPGKRDSND